MKKIITLLVFTSIATFVFITKVKAQDNPNPWRIDAGGELGIPGGQIHSLSSTSIGVTIRLQYNITDKFSIMATSGLYHFGITSTTDTYTTLGNTVFITGAVSQEIIPVKLGLKYFVIPEFYVAAEGGVGFEEQYGDYKKTIVAPGIGWQNDSFDVGVRYENFIGQGYNYSTVALRVAYGFGFKLKKEKVK